MISYKPWYLQSADAVIKSLQGIRSNKCIRRFTNLLLFTILIAVIWRFRKDLLDALKLSTTIGWKFLLLPVLFLIWNTFATKGWQCLLNRTSGTVKISFLRLYKLRVESQALNQILPVSGIGGEALRSYSTRNVSGLKSSTSIVVIDKTIDITSDFVLAVIGLLIAQSIAKLSFSIFVMLSILLVILFTIVLFWQQILRKTIPFISSIHLHKNIQSILQNNSFGKASRVSFLYHLVEHIFMMLEIYIVSLFIGTELGIKELLYCNAIGTLFNILFVAVPARAGAFECSLAFAFTQIGFPPSTGISIALTRRARQILVCLSGFLLLMIKRNTKFTNSNPVTIQSNGCQRALLSNVK